MRKVVILSFFLLCFSCTKEEEEPYVETICPEGFLTCYDRPCSLPF